MDLRQKAQNRKLCIHAIAENVSPLASGKTFIANEKLKQEEAWNAGASLSFNIPVAGKELELNIDYYYTDFDNQMVLNPYSLNHENKYIIGNLSGKSQCRDFLEASWRHHWQIPGAQGHHHQVSASYRACRTRRLPTICSSRSIRSSPTGATLPRSSISDRLRV